MLIAAYLQEARFFRRCAFLVLTRARSARALLWGLVAVAGGLSALLVNDTVCVVLTPLVLAVVVERGCRRCRTCWRSPPPATSVAWSASAATRRT
ncbi:MAG: SLC13 family permease [Kofleriaceae bacterium]